MEGHFERDESLGGCLSTYWISINTLLPCNYFHNGFLNFDFYSFYNIKSMTVTPQFCPFCIPFPFFPKCTIIMFVL